MPDLPPLPPDPPRVRVVLEVPRAVWVALVLALLAVAWAAFVYADERQAEGVDRRKALTGSPLSVPPRQP